MAKGSSELIKEKEVDTFWFVAIPSMLVILGMILNNFQVVFDRPQYSLEEDPLKNLQPNGVSSICRESDS